jgi:hypothetical protein
MTGEYPGKDHRRVAAAEDLVGERESRGAGSDPVQPIEDRKIDRLIKSNSLNGMTINEIPRRL